MKTKTDKIEAVLNLTGTRGSRHAIWIGSGLLFMGLQSVFICALHSNITVLLIVLLDIFVLILLQNVLQVTSPYI